MQIQIPYKPLVSVLAGSNQSNLRITAERRPCRQSTCQPLGM